MSDKQQYTFKNIMVTGGAGFIGAHFINYFLHKYRKINLINLDKLTYAANLSRLDNIYNYRNYIFTAGDICDSVTVAGIMERYQIDTIVNFAAETHVDNSIADPTLFIHTNVVGTHNLLQQALLYWKQSCQLSPAQCRFHQISTDEVYGSLSSSAPPFTETSLLNPSSPYAASKAAADHLVQAYSKTYKLPITISRCSNNYGAMQHHEKLIPKIIECCRKQHPIPIYNTGCNIRDWIHVDDHCAAIDVILRHGNIGNNYNVGAANEHDNLTIAHLICSHMDHLMPQHAPHHNLITFVTDRLGHDFRYAINSQQMFTEFKWRATTSLKVAIHKMINQVLNIHETDTYETDTHVADVI